ncbi:PRD domain-containing protein [Virgibacillus pantothenticus]|uniref:BglG family transcription antiterminator n=1 Tax=Virgibacillus pantothenticus TaxID=1473 RepID=UPI001C225454|nr:PRD domain-containing protein [Virgibacillus pantothenticus]MBU8568640.1 PRD domain-containing protein [Virgibacillus pantothenticus]MBU8602617.1 PRD domain-containing protein [Virgibacillus pantothenticus]MBU8636738.1 PRD domain-containing protein [Virgibacillus pantothenticus]MBU8644493.1 PRD domain-containing protein [Virgibacillus pantothenticus]MBU8648556.1 PRD domain-containing protein [Virgibacillus pantothenticus]
MNNIEILLDYLRKQAGEHYVSSRTLAEALNVSDRTVRNYVKAINEKHPNLIESSRSGYRIGEEENRQVHKDTNSTSHAKSRRFYILRRLIKRSERGLDLFDLADTLYVSDATIRSDMAQLNQLVNKHGLQITQHHHRYLLKGNEKSRRKLMIDLIDYSKPTSTSLEEEIQMFLGDISLQALMKLSKESFEKYHVHPNTYFFKNFILHLAIAVDRASDNEQLEKSSYHVENRTAVSFQAVEEIAERLYENHQIRLSQADKDELSILFVGQSNLDKTLVNNYTSNDVSRALDHAIQEISDVYMVDFDNDSFRNRLLIHIQNLYNRLLQNKYTRNLSVLNIRIKYPIIFDIAVYLASVLSNDLDVEINDDEIAFLALHIGSYLNSRPEEDQKIKTIIITPAYLSQQSDIQQVIERNFEDDLEVAGVYEDVSEINELLSPEFVITTQDVNQLENAFATIHAEIVSIHEFITKHDITLIRRKIEEIKHHKYVRFIKKKIPELIKEEFLIHFHETLSKKQIMETIADVFQRHNYVPADYLEKLNQREKISATSYPSGIAIPHTMKYEADKTGLIILIPEAPVDWDSNEVKLIIGMAVNKQDTHTFNQIFPRIIELVAESYHVNYLAGAKNREVFIDRLIELMGAGEYFLE